jgi:hypothetical protein
MAKHKYPWMALSKLLNAKTELSTADFDGLADITASAAEVNVVDGVTAGTVTASKAVIVGSDSAVSGMKRKVVGAPAGAVLTAAHSGNIYTNAGASGAGSFDLPAATVGLYYSFYVVAAQELRINPNGSETIGLPSSGVQQAAGKYITADAAGEYVDIVCITAGKWETLNYRGTWGVEG